MQAQGWGALNGVEDFRALFDAMPDPYAVFRPDDPSYTIVFANRAYRRVTETKGADVRSAEWLRESLRKVMATKASHPVADGGGVVSPVCGEDGELRYIVHRMEARRAEAERLVRERAELEEKLLVSEARFGLAFQRAPIGMVLLTPEGRLTEVNQAYVEMLGYSLEDLATRDSSFFTHPDDVEPTRNFFADLRSGRITTGSIEKRYFRKNGELLWARASATMRRDDAGRPAQVIAIVEDITARKSAEVRYHFLADTLPQMLWTATPEGLVDYVNGQGTAYFDAPQKALLGAGWLEFVHPQDREKSVARWQHSVETGEPYETEFRLRRGSDGSWRRHLTRALPLTGDQGKRVQWFGTCTDIEDQREADANLQYQWQTFDTALSNTPDFIFTLDVEGRFTYANRALLSLWQRTLPEAVGRNFFDLGYPDELAGRLQSQIQHVVGTRTALRDQTPFTGPTGETRYYDYIFVPVSDSDGRVRAVAGSTRDITEQNLASKQIEEDRGRWRELLYQTPAAIAVLRGPKHRLEWVNPDYGRLVRRPAEALIGRTVLEALPEVAGQAYIDLLDGVYRTGEPYVAHEALFRADRGDGLLQDVYVNFVYLATRDSAGAVDGIFAHITDVTDMVLTRRHLEESERQFRTLAETIPHLAWMADETGHIFWYNRRWYDYTGTTFEEIEGWDWQKLHDPDVLPDVLEQWRSALASGEPFEMIFPLRRADGEFRPFLTRVEAVRDNQGHVVRWFGTNTDITEQRRTEEKLRRMNRELEEFAYVASHDLQEPLRMVNIYTELILKNVQSEDPAMSQYSEFVQQGVMRMEALIHDLLTFSRTVHTEDVRAGAADLTASLNEALSVLKSRIEDAGAVIHVEALPSVRGDAGQLAHVFQNILSNALKYRTTGVTPEIRIGVVREQDAWVVSVQDNGIGFEPQYAERIFGLFKRLHKDEYPGTGLGLAICKRIVERYGGRIWGESKLGEGATFFFALPPGTFYESGRGGKRSGQYARAGEYAS